MDYQICSRPRPTISSQHMSLYVPLRARARVRVVLSGAGSCHRHTVGGGTRQVDAQPQPCTTHHTSKHVHLPVSPLYLPYCHASSTTRPGELLYVNLVLVKCFTYDCIYVSRITICAPILFQLLSQLMSILTDPTEPTSTRSRSSRGSRSRSIFRHRYSPQEIDAARAALIRASTAYPPYRHRWD